MSNPHPGEILRDCYLKRHGISASMLASCCKVPTNRITEILKGRRSISADTALRLSRALGNSASYWLNLQQLYDLKGTQPKIQVELDRILPIDQFPFH